MKKQSTRFWMLMTLIAFLFTSPSMVLAQSSLAGLSDTLVHTPPAIGSFAYNSFLLPLTQGASYVDPVFGTTVRRLTTDHVDDDTYATNMRWNADETRFLHRTTNGTPWPDYWEVIDAATGTITHTGIPNGAAISAADGGFDPADPNVLYYYGSNGIHKVTLNTDGTWSDAVYFTPPGSVALKPLGGTLNWLDASGRYMVVRYGPEPSVYLYDRQNMAAGPYANPVNGATSIDTGSYIGITPDGQFLVGYQSGSGIGFGGMGQGVSWKIDQTNRAIATAPNIFWSLCGDHGSFISPSDGRDYMIVNDCYGNAGLWRVDITNNANGLNEAQQQALPNNKRILTYSTWNDFGHYTTAARGPLQDWAFASSEDSTDIFNSGTADGAGNITPWHTYRQEIIAINVMTGEVRQLAHHRSRSIGINYYNQPRVSASWGGKYVGFASDFNQSGVVDIYAVTFSATSIALNVSITAPLSGATMSGTTMVSATATDNVSVVGVQFNLDGTNLGSEVMSAPYSIVWNTTNAANGAHTLTAVARDAAGNVTTSSAAVIVANATSTTTTTTTTSTTTTTTSTTTTTTTTSTTTATTSTTTTLQANTSSSDLVMIVVRGPYRGVGGQNVIISDIVKNQGTAGTGSTPFRVGFYLSKNSTITTSDIFLGSRWVSSLAPGTFSQGATQVSIPPGLTLGIYYIGAIADDTNVITETNELNNNLAGNRIYILQ